MEKGKAALVSAGLPGLSAGEVLPGRWYEESLGRVALRACRRSLRERSAGRGRLELRQRPSAHAGLVRLRRLRHEPEEATRRFYAGLLDWAGVTRPVAATGDPVEVRLLESGREHLAFVFNHAATPATTVVTLRVPLDGRAVEEMATGEAVAARPTADGFEWRGTIPPRDVRVLRIH